MRLAVVGADVKAAAGDDCESRAKKAAALIMVALFGCFMALFDCLLSYQTPQNT